MLPCCIAGAVVMSLLMSQALEEEVNREEDEQILQNQRASKKDTHDTSAQAGAKFQEYQSYQGAGEYVTLFFLAVRVVSRETGVSFWFGLLCVSFAMVLVPACVYLEVLHRYRGSHRRESERFAEDDNDREGEFIKKGVRRGGARGGKNYRRKKEAIARQTSGGKGDWGSGGAGDMGSMDPNVFQVGRLEVWQNNVLGHGSHGTIVYTGKLDQRKVAVKRLLGAFFDVSSVMCRGHVLLVRVFRKMSPACCVRFSPIQVKPSSPFH